MLNHEARKSTRLKITIPFGIVCEDISLLLFRKRKTSLSRNKEASARIVSVLRVEEKGSLIITVKYSVQDDEIRRVSPHDESPVS
jgi:hypothetical protein